MPPPIINVTRDCSAETTRCGSSGAIGAACDGVAANPGRFCDASRRITRTSSSTERPWRAARSRSSALTASSSLLIVRLANVSPRYLQAMISQSDCIAIRSELADGQQNPDEGGGDDPQ